MTWHSMIFLGRHVHSRCRTLSTLYHTSVRCIGEQWLFPGYSKQFLSCHRQPCTLVSSPILTVCSQWGNVSDQSCLLLRLGSPPPCLQRIFLSHLLQGKVSRSQCVPHTPVWKFVVPCHSSENEFFINKVVVCVYTRAFRKSKSLKTLQELRKLPYTSYLENQV